MLKPYQSFEGPDQQMGRGQRLAQLLQSRPMSNFATNDETAQPPQYGSPQVAMNGYNAKPQSARLFPPNPIAKQPMPKSPGMYTPQGGDFKGDYYGG